MRIAISVETNDGLESVVSHHFGRCPYFVLVNVEDQEVQDVQVIDNPYYEHHQPGMVPGFIQSQGAEVMISGGMGRRAIGFFQQLGIRAATGGSGTASVALESYLNGDLQSAEPCRESERHGEHDHHGSGGRRGKGRQRQESDL